MTKSTTGITLSMFCRHHPKKEATLQHERQKGSLYCFIVYKLEGRMAKAALEPRPDCAYGSEYRQSLCVENAFG